MATSIPLFIIRLI